MSVEESKCAIVEPEVNQSKTSRIKSLEKFEEEQKVPESKQKSEINEIWNLDYCSLDCSAASAIISRWCSSIVSIVINNFTHHNARQKRGDRDLQSFHCHSENEVYQLQYQPTWRIVQAAGVCIRETYSQWDE